MIRVRYLQTTRRPSSANARCCCCDKPVAVGSPTVRLLGAIAVVHVDDEHRIPNAGPVEGTWRDNGKPEQFGLDLGRHAIDPACAAKLGGEWHRPAA